jgi:hypothetical protein
LQKSSEPASLQLLQKSPPETNQEPFNLSSTRNQHQQNQHFPWLQESLLLLQSAILNHTKKKKTILPDFFRVLCLVFNLEKKKRALPGEREREREREEQEGKKEKKTKKKPMIMMFLSLENSNRDYLGMQSKWWL